MVEIGSTIIDVEDSRRVHHEIIVVSVDSNTYWLFHDGGL